MDKLKKNGFAIGLSALGAGALALLYFLVLGKMWGSGPLAEARDGLADAERRLARFAKQPEPVPSQKVATARKEAAKRWDEALQAARAFYDTRRDKFNERPPGADDDLTSFRAWYETEVDRFIKDYRTKFHGAPAPAGQEGAAPPGEAVPAIAQQEAAAAPPVPAVANPDNEIVVPWVDRNRLPTDSDIPRAMKEYWILDDVFKVATDLNLGGLLEIQFPERGAAAAAASTASKEAAASKEASGSKEGGGVPREHRWIKTRITLELNLGQLDAFATRLLQSEKVPFRVDALEVHRPPGTALTKMVESKLYENEAEAKKESAEALRQEPKVEAILHLAALEWIGTQEKQP